MYDRFLHWTHICQIQTVTYRIRPLLLCLLPHPHARSHTLLRFMSLIFVSNFLQEVPLMTASFHWPRGSCCPSLVATPDGKRNRPDRWCQSDIIWSSTSNMGAEPHSAFSYSGRSSSVTPPPPFIFCSFHPQILILQNKWNWLVI